MDGTVVPSTDTSSTVDLPEQFDFIIVGGGTAGLVLASRLTEDAHRKVLVLEAGPNRLNDPNIRVPGFSRRTYSNPDYDWNFMSVPQDNLHGRMVAQTRGRVLGGSAAINQNMLAYPSKTGVNAWGALGNDGWNWETLLPYYRKFHTFTPPTKEIRDVLGLDYMNEKAHGTSGPIQTSFGELQGPTEKAWPKTFNNLNWKMTGDPLSGESIGGMSNPCTIDPKTKERSHAGSTYYKMAADRPNLRVVTEALVEKIVLEKSNERVVASGVNFTPKDGQSFTIRAAREVILSAGVFKSPQLLELSGIGSTELLRSHGIEVVINNPQVGENLQDHGMAGVSFEAADGVRTADAMRDPKVREQVVSMYKESRTGPLANSTFSSASTPIVEFLDAKGQKTLDELLDKYLPADGKLAFPAQKQQYNLLRSVLKSPGEASIHYLMGPFQHNVLEGPSTLQYMNPVTPGNYITILAALSHPFSRGSVHIASADPKEDPIIDPKYLSHPLDREVLARHLQYVETIVETEPLASLLKKEGRRIPAGTSLKELESAKKHAELITSNFHPACTCAMMPEEIGGVVNERLIVHGTSNLRVVDASIFPLEPRGNIQTTVYAVAEKAADLIKEDNKQETNGF